MLYAMVGDLGNSVILHFSIAVFSWLNCAFANSAEEEANQIGPCFIDYRDTKC